MPFDLQKPIAWVGADRLLISDITPNRLHRTVVARKGEVMDVESWMKTVVSQARENEVDGWLVEIGEFWFLWLIWKEIE
jgi:hypothetical protein